MLRDKLGEFTIYDESLVEQDGTTYLLVKAPNTLGSLNVPRARS